MGIRFQSPWASLCKCTSNSFLNKRKQQKKNLLNPRPTHYIMGYTTTAKGICCFILNTTHAMDEALHNASVCREDCLHVYYLRIWSFCLSKPLLWLSEMHISKQIPQSQQQLNCVAQTLFLALDLLTCPIGSVPGAEDNLPLLLQMTGITQLSLCQPAEVLPWLNCLEKLVFLLQSSHKWKTEPAQMETTEQQRRLSCHAQVPCVPCSWAQDFSSWAASSESQAEKRDIYGILVLLSEKYASQKWQRNESAGWWQTTYGEQGRGSFWHHCHSTHPRVTHIILWGPVHFYRKTLAAGMPSTKWKPFCS